MSKWIEGLIPAVEENDRVPNEIEVIRQIVDLLERVAPETRDRIARYLAQRYCE